jgi:hypothetical protein
MESLIELVLGGTIPTPAARQYPVQVRCHGLDLDHHED